MKKLLVLLMVVVLAFAGLTGCKSNKDNGESPVVSEESSAKPTDEKDDKSGDVKELDYGTYDNTLLGINFRYDKRLFVEEKTADVMNALAPYTKDGGKFDINRNQLPNNLSIVTLSAKDKLNTTITVALAPYITAGDVALAEDGSVPAIDPAEPIREITVDDAFAAAMSEGIKNGLTEAQKTLVGEISSSVVEFTPVQDEKKDEKKDEVASPAPNASPDSSTVPAPSASTDSSATPAEATPETTVAPVAPFKGVVLEYSYEGLKGKYSVIHVNIPCGKNMINIIATSQEGKSDFDKYAIVTQIVESLKKGIEFVKIDNLISEDTSLPEGALVGPTAEQAGETATKSEASAR